MAQVCAVLRPGREPAPVRETLAQGCKGETAIAEKGGFSYDNKNDSAHISEGGCGDQELPDNAVQLGVFNVSIYGLNVDQGTELGGDAGAITGTVKIRFSDSGSSTQAVPYRGMFNATVGGSNLNQVAPTGTLVVSDALLGKPFATKEVTLKLSFPDVATREAYQSGKPAYLTITINNITGVLYLVKRGDGYVATKTVG